MKVEIDENSGFCFGVVNAIAKAEEELQHGRLYCIGDIVHNSLEVERLKQLGLSTIDHDEFARLKACRVLFRAHGEPPSSYELAKKNGIEVIDASCPVVLNLQKKIREAYEEVRANGGQIVIYGKRGHAEVNGLVAQTNDEALIIEQEEDLKSIDFFDVMAYPTAQLDILSLMPLTGATVTGRTHRLQGQLSVLRAERAIECDAELRNLPDGELSMFCQLVWDRTLWGVRYGSARFYRFLGMHSVDDNISLSAMLFFRSQRP